MKFEEYKKNYEESIRDTDSFLRKHGSKLLHWDVPFTKGYDENTGKFFTNGLLNPCYNALDRHVEAQPDKIAFIRLDNQNECTKITYKQLYDEVLKKAGIFKKFGLEKGDVVSFYGNNSYDMFACVLACGRLGLVCHFIFGGYSADVVAKRIRDTKSKLVLTIDVAERGEKTANYFETVAEAVRMIAYKCNVIVFNKNPLKSQSNIHAWSDLVCTQYEYTECVSVDSDANILIIFTSGSSGNSKGIVHATAGFLFGTIMTIKLCFGFDGRTDVFLSTADIGWLACVTHTIYGPLLCGGTTVILEGTPFYPHYTRLFEIINDYKVSHLYTAPTVIRMLQKFMKQDRVSIYDIRSKYDLTSLKAIGCVGEILNEGALELLNNFTVKPLPIINTYWQTETGTIMLSPLIMDNHECKGVGVPVYCVEPKVMKADKKTGGLVECSENEKGILLFVTKWPSLATTLLNEHTRYKETYFDIYPGHYYTGDEALKDGNGNYYILGRVDDVINVSGHRISTMEIENKLSTCANVAEIAVVGIPDEITGQKVCIDLVGIDGYSVDMLRQEMKEFLLAHFGRILGQYEIRIHEELPKTTTGKLLRRVLRNVKANVRAPGSN